MTPEETVTEAAITLCVGQYHYPLACNFDSRLNIWCVNYSELHTSRYNIKLTQQTFYYGNVTLFAELAGNVHPDLCPHGPRLSSLPTPEGPMTS